MISHNETPTINPNPMKIIKRTGEECEVEFDRITDRIRSLSDGLSIDPVTISQKVASSLKDRMTTSELDELSSSICVARALQHPDYLELAARITISNHRKNTSENFAEVMNQLHDEPEQPLVSDHVVHFLARMPQILDFIDYERDNRFDYFGFKTLQRSYLLQLNGKIVERPQHMYMRVAIGLNVNDADTRCTPSKFARIVDTYNQLSLGKYTHATPTLFHAGTPSPQNLSCFLMGTEDSVTGIFKTITDCAHISKWAGGIGVHMSNIRSNGSYIKGTGGHSTGIMPMLKVYNDTARYINQCFAPGTIVFTKQGPKAIAMITTDDYVVTETGEFKKVNEVIVNEVEDREMVAFRSQCSIDLTFCTTEHEILVEREGEKKYVPADDLQLYDHLCFPSHLENTDFSMPRKWLEIYGLIQAFGAVFSNGAFLHAVVAAPEHLRATFANACRVVQNPAVIDEDFSSMEIILPPEIFTEEMFHRDGHTQIYHEMLHMESKPHIEVLLTALLTERHMFQSPSKLLVEGIRFLLMKLGVLCSGCVMVAREDGTAIYTLNVPKTEATRTIFDDDDDEAPPVYMNNNDTIQTKIFQLRRTQYTGKVYDLNIEGIHSYTTEAGIVHNSGKRLGSFAMYLEPWHADVVAFLDAKKNTGSDEERARDLFYAMWIPDLFMERVQQNAVWSLMCPQECPGLNDCHGDEFKTLYIGYEDSHKFRCQIPARDLFDRITASQIETGTPYMIYKDSVNRHSNQSNVGMIRSSNLCAEITEYSDSDEYACCCLASLSLPSFLVSPTVQGEFHLITKEGCAFCSLAKDLLAKNNIVFSCAMEPIEQGQTYPRIYRDAAYIGGFTELFDLFRPQFDYDAFEETIAVVVGNLNRVIDSNFYPVPETHKSNSAHRPLGIGVQGLADVFFKMRYAYDSDQARDLNKDIFKHLYFYALKASCALAEVQGAYPTYEGSPLSRGRLQPDLWGVATPDDLDWNTLRARVAEHGVRNSLLVALMPTASTAQILGNTEAFEPVTSNIYTRKTLAGEFPLINRYLINDLVAMDLWSDEMRDRLIYAKGSVQRIPQIPAVVRALYKTAFEIKQKVILNMAIDRSPFVCQSQSLNLFVNDPTQAKLMKMHFYGWQQGLKTGSYYIRSNPASYSQNFTIDPDLENKFKEEELAAEEGCAACSA